MRVFLGVFGGAAAAFRSHRATDVDGSLDVDLATDAARSVLSSAAASKLLEDTLGDWSWLQSVPSFENMLKGVPLDSMVKNLADIVPANVLTALRRHKGVGPESLSEDELNNARKVINGMMEGQVNQLDITVVQCKELREKNTQTENVVVADLSRLGSKLANEKKRILEAQGGIEDATGEIGEGTSKLKAHQKRCSDHIGSLESQLALIKADLDSARLIVDLTECPKKALLQASNATSTSLQTCTDDGRQAVVNAKNQSIALRTANSAAAFDRAFAASLTTSQQQRSALIATVRAVEGAAAKPKGPKIEGYKAEPKAGACTAFDGKGKAIEGCEVFKQSENIYKAMGKPEDCARLCTEKPLCKSFEYMVLPEAPGMCIHKYGKCTADSKCFKKGKEFHPFTTYNMVGDAPVMPGKPDIPEIKEARAAPPAAKQAFKCTMADADCGLLNDNMSLFWGEVKDKYDEKFAEITAAKKECQDIEDTINEEITLWNALLQERNADLGAATGEQSEATQTQIDKQREQRELKGEFKEIDAKCKHLVGEIMMNLCGLRKVRGELATFSKGSMKPELIVDCVTTDWVPQQCSVDCKGGVQTLGRAVSQQPSLGIKCPPLQMIKKCNEFPCPVACQMGDWSQYGRCSKECGGGLQGRVRNIKVRPDFGGEACPPQTETQQCNPDSCDVDCALSEWSKWKPCTKACGKGSQRRLKHVTAESKGAGKCPKMLNAARYERRECNTGECPPDPICDAKMDVVFVIDSSGSWTEKGYNVVKKFIGEYVSNYKLGKHNVKMGIVEFSKEAHIVQGMTFDMKEIEKAIAEKLIFRRGLTDLAKGLLTAEKVLLDGRKDSQSEVIVITDGKPSFKFQTGNAAKKLRRSGTRLVFMPVRTYGSSPFLLDWASHPGNENVFRVKAGLAELAEKSQFWQAKLLVSTCPKVYSPLLASLAGEKVPQGESAPGKGDVKEGNPFR
mmetsp:Transcript_31594/g.69191  ORF Transcript_31594/g.69191 Transcript_31594/m.69191 type:complete len:962 (-) Transcript_31594:43-2928(-)|eukprot:CAMPEP_0204252540 /NCGR_PEP_ID=MMETSP0468-20130131/1237_1 /ASSEMBLY_ACC=CAM_ASM_000383 /TAXON_ID=2969 /ORGANISM="Oxyrrhis marina" /LENGTH=961 /DNA_ID=CAMNT_0051225979 /DNA_START=110 /DNA_END=2995 /DNA_ORIENTATION=-